MALTLNFTREPINGGDLANWYGYVMQQVRGGGPGALSSEMYNNAGALTVRCGFIGINNGVTKGMAEVTVSGDISLAGLTDGQWAQVELSVAGTAGALSITSMGASYDDEYLIPANIKAAYDEEKQGYYLTASKRVIGCVFIRTGAVLGRVVNCENGEIGFKGITPVDYVAASGVISTKYKARIEIESGPWNMRAAAGGVDHMSFTPPFYIKKKRLASVYVLGDSGAEQSIALFTNLADPNLVMGGIYSIGSSQITLYRRTGGYFDSADYAGTVVNRAVVTVEWDT